MESLSEAAKGAYLSLLVGRVVVPVYYWEQNRDGNENKNLLIEEK